MKRLKPKITTEYEIDKVICNCCGEEIPQDSYGHIADYLSVEKQWGYGASFDGETHSFDLCDKCYGKIISSFKIPIDK